MNKNKERKDAVYNEFLLPFSSHPGKAVHEEFSSILHPSLRIQSSFYAEC